MRGGRQYGLPVLDCCGPAPHDDDCPAWIATKARLDAEWDATPTDGHGPVELLPWGSACCGKCGALWPCDYRMAYLAARAGG